MDNQLENCSITETLLASLESVANFLRGMQLDRSLPTNVIDAIRDRVESIDGVTESITMQDPKRAASVAESAVEIPRANKGSAPRKK